MLSADIQKALQIYGYDSINEISMIDLKQRYKVLAKKHHPDRGGEEEMFIAIREWYQLLRDELENPSIPHNNTQELTQLEQIISNQQNRIQEYETMITSQVHIITQIQPLLDNAHKLHTENIDSLDRWYNLQLEKLKAAYESSFMDILLNKTKLTQNQNIIEKNSIIKSYNSQLLSLEQDYTKQLLEIYKTSIEAVIDSYT